MKTKPFLRLIGIFTICASNLLAQNFWVPDANFRNKLKIFYPSCFTVQDSLITNSASIQSVTTIIIDNSNISSLDGIQYFSWLVNLDCHSNELTSLPALPVTLISLNCRDNQLTSLPTLPATLSSLNCSNNQLSSLPVLPTSLTTLNCSSNSLTTLPPLPSALTIIYCYINQLTSLPAIPATLTDLWCNNNPLTSLPSLPASLTFLNCNSNQLTSLPALPATLKTLYCSYNPLTTLPVLPSTLTTLAFINIQLTNLPALPSTLKILYCGDNQLSNLPALPATLVDLNCPNNQLTNLPALPSTLIYLQCFNNQLTSLPVLPPSLTTLYCAYNHLTNLPALPASIIYLECYYNQLTSLPALPASLSNLFCHHNQLTSLPRIPGNTHVLDCRNNPITCFPEIAPRIQGSIAWNYIKIDSTLISCILNQVTFPLSVVQSSQALPLCSPNNNSCNYNFTIGSVFLDTNGNGINDNLEQGLEIPVYYSGNSGIIPDSSGFFYASSDTGNITFQVVVPLYYAATSPSSQTIHVVNGVVDTLYFGLQPVGNFNDLKIDLTSIGFLRPGFKAKYELHFQNVGTTTLNNVQLKFLKPTQLSNLLAIPTPNMFSGDTLIWNIGSLNPYQNGNMVISDSVFSSAVLGDTATAFAWIEPLIGDTTPVNNSGASIAIIRGAYDPNDKSVSINSLLPNSTDFLEYTIRFQNTGTDTAFTVTLLDKLSDLLDVSSMQMISASHNNELSIVNGFAKWVFKNILLPDSNSNELESHGFVKFKIKPLPGLTVTDSIQNKAVIYFDYNAAVTTNTIVVNVLNTTQVKELNEMELQIFPNPVQESIRIVNQHAGSLGKIELINSNGKVLETKIISTSSYTWNLQQLPDGTYILKGQGWGQKVVKE